SLLYEDELESKPLLMLLTLEYPLVMESVEPVPEDKVVETPFPAIDEGRVDRRTATNTTDNTLVVFLRRMC
ncbi:MAG: hypothetical protein ACPGMY_07935, partial [Poseidonia sp.]